MNNWGLKMKKIVFLFFVLFPASSFAAKFGFFGKFEGTFTGEIIQISDKEPLSTSTGNDMVSVDTSTLLSVGLSGDVMGSPYGDGVTHSDPMYNPVLTDTITTHSGVGGLGFGVTCANGIGGVYINSISGYSHPTVESVQVFHARIKAETNIPSTYTLNIKSAVSDTPYIFKIPSAWSDISGLTEAERTRELYVPLTSLNIVSGDVRIYLDGTIGSATKLIIQIGIEDLGIN